MIACGKQKVGGEDGTQEYACLKLAGHKGTHAYGRRELVEQIRESANPVQEAFDAAHLRHHALRNLKPSPSDKCPLCADNRALALACMEATWQAAYSEYGYVSEEEFAVALGPLRARINALHQDGREPPQEEGT